MADFTERLRHVSRWHVLPDFASVNFHEEGADEMARLLHARGIGIEAGVSNDGAVAALVESGLGPICVRVLVEPVDPALPLALAALERMESALSLAEIAIPRILHGVDATAWPLLDETVRRGYAVRMGLEDTFRTLDGRHATDNAELVDMARRRIGLLGLKAMRRV